MYLKPIGRPPYAFFVNLKKNIRLPHKKKKSIFKFRALRVIINIILNILSSPLRTFAPNLFKSSERGRLNIDDL